MCSIVEEIKTLKRPMYAYSVKFRTRKYARTFYSIFNRNYDPEYYRKGILYEAQDQPRSAFPKPVHHLRLTYSNGEGFFHLLKTKKDAKQYKDVAGKWSAQIFKVKIPAKQQIGFGTIETGCYGAGIQTILARKIIFL